MSDLIERGIKLKNWATENWGICLNEDMIALEKCPCGGATSFVWGMKNDKGQTRYLRNEYGVDVKKCGSCMIEDEKKIEKETLYNYCYALEKIRKQKSEPKESSNGWGKL